MKTRIFIATIAMVMGAATYSQAQPIINPNPAPLATPRFATENPPFVAASRFQFATRNPQFATPHFPRVVVPNSRFATTSPFANSPNAPFARMPRFATPLPTFTVENPSFTVPNPEFVPSP